MSTRPYYQAVIAALLLLISCKNNSEDPNPGNMQPVQASCRLASYTSAPLNTTILYNANNQVSGIKFTYTRQNQKDSIIANLQYDQSGRLTEIYIDDNNYGVCPTEVTDW